MGRGHSTGLFSGIKGNSQLGLNQGIANQIKTIYIGYNKNKLEGYLLNKDHPTGKSKAKFFSEILGFDTKDAKQLNKALNDAIKGKKPKSQIQTSHGIKLTYAEKVKGKNKNSAVVIIVVQKDKGKTSWKLVTAYPGKKDKK